MLSFEQSGVELQDRGHGAASLLAPGQEGIRRPCRRNFELASARERLRWLLVALPSLGAARGAAATTRRFRALASSKCRRQGRLVPSWPAPAARLLRGRDPGAPLHSAQNLT